MKKKEFKGTFKVQFEVYNSLTKSKEIFEETYSDISFIEGENFTKSNSLARKNIMCEIEYIFHGSFSQTLKRKIQIKIISIHKI